SCSHAAYRAAYEFLAAGVNLQWASIIKSGERMDLAGGQENSPCPRSTPGPVGDELVDYLVGVAIREGDEGLYTVVLLRPVELQLRALYRFEVFLGHLPVRPGHPDQDIGHHDLALAPRKNDADGRVYRVFLVDLDLNGMLGGKRDSRAGNHPGPGRSLRGLGTTCRGLGTPADCHP